ncbi:MAG: hypothetical protein AAGF53_05200 [Pseudomonadota bacterium]
MEMFSLWWVWLSAALLLAIIEIMIPGFIFLGIAIGAAITALVIVIVPGLAFSTLMVIFGLLSLVAWLILRSVFRAPNDQTRIIHEDIND